MNDKRPTATEIRSVFRRPVVPQGTAQHYRIRLASVLLGLAILQFLYLLLIAAVVTLTIAYTGAMVDSHVPANLITLVFYIGGPAAGCISVLFLLKPIIIRPPRPPRPIWLPHGSSLTCESIHRPRNKVGAACSWAIST